MKHPTTATMVLTVLFTLCGGLRVATAHEDRGTGYEPCHLLCSNEAGRTEARSAGEGRTGTFGFRLESIYIEPSGVYLDDRFRPIESGADAFAVQFLTAGFWQPTPRIRLTAGMPWEYNQASGVVLPTLKPTDTDSGQLEPGGIFASIQYALLAWDGGETWVGIGYRLSTPIGTSELDRQQVAQFPDKALEGLGVGTDNVYGTASIVVDGPVSGATVGGGLELHVNMLPRWETHYGTTAAWRGFWRQSLSDRWWTSLRAGGFYTSLPTLDISQYSLLIPSAELGFRATEGVQVFGGVGAHVPTTALHANALRAWSGSLGVEFVF